MILRERIVCITWLVVTMALVDPGGRGQKEHMPPPRQIGDDFDDFVIKLALGAWFWFWFGTAHNALVDYHGTVVKDICGSNN